LGIVCTLLIHNWLLSAVIGLEHPNARAPQLWQTHHPLPHRLSALDPKRAVARECRQKALRLPAQEGLRA